MKQFVLILRGAPASGKSTIAKRLRDFDRKVVWLKVDSFKDFFAEDASLALDYVNGTANAALKYLLDQGFSIVMDGIFQDTGAIDRAKEIASTRSVLIKVFELESSLEVLQERDKNRDGVKKGCRKPLGNAVIKNLFDVVTNNAYLGAVKISTENVDLEDTVKAIKSEVGQ